MKLFKERKQEKAYNLQILNLESELENQKKLTEKYQKSYEDVASDNIKITSEKEDLRDKIEELRKLIKHNAEAELAYNLLKSFESFFKHDKNTMTNLEMQRNQQMALLQSMGNGNLNSRNSMQFNAFGS